MRQDFTRKVVELDESMREMAALDELYEDILRSSPETKNEVAVKKDEAKFAKDRILKLSLHVKNLLSSLESHETLK